MMSIDESVVNSTHDSVLLSTLASILDFEVAKKWLEGHKNVKDFTYKGVAYQVACDEAFLRLYSMIGHRYWIGQANAFYRIPDWKLHFPIEQQDLPVAWRILAQEFVKHECLSGMKVEIGVKRPSFQRGREITVYIYRYHPELRGATVCVCGPNTPSVPLSPKFEHSANFWFHFAKDCEFALRNANISPAKPAVGDKQLQFPDGSICSCCTYRNEAFIPLTQQLLSSFSVEEKEFYAKHRGLGGRSYPPNAAGYNAAWHQDPFNPRKSSKIWVEVAVLILLISLGMLLFKAVIC